MQVSKYLNPLFNLANLCISTKSAAKISSIRLTIILRLGKFFLFGLCNSSDKILLEFSTPNPSFCFVFIICLIANVPQGFSLKGILSISLTIILSQRPVVLIHNICHVYLLFYLRHF